MRGKLYLVPTPIGNLGDITLRALEVLRNADIICAEDTRRARILFEKYEIRKVPVSYRDQNAERLAPQIADWVAEGRIVALISDAGSPGISDPGFRAARAVMTAGLPLEALPGPTSVIPALVMSGLAVDRFAFDGFLPVKKGRRTRLQELAQEPRTMMFFEAPHRLARTLADLAAALGGDRRSAIARELTKIHEEVVRGTLGELAEKYGKLPPRGEMVLVVEGLAGYEKRGVLTTD